MSYCDCAHALFDEAAMNGQTQPVDDYDTLRMRADSKPIDVDMIRPFDTTGLSCAATGD